MDEKGADGYFGAINALFPDFSASNQSKRQIND